MSTIVKFSDVCGENVEISEDKTVATWISKNSSGWACSEDEVKPGDVTEVKVEGSGHCDVGFMKYEQSPSTFKTLHEVRAHRKTCSIEVTFKETGDEISSQFCDRTFTKKIRNEAKVWIAIFIRYGDMSVQLFTKGQSQINQGFSSIKHGTNIKLENDNTEAISVSKNPASICFISERLEVGETLYLNCAPEKEGDRQPSKYELKLQVCNKDPSTLKNEFKYLFEASEAKRSDPPLTTIESIEKDECNGVVAITLSDNKTVHYKTAGGKQNTQGLNFMTQNGVWVVLDLYRVKVQAINHEDISGAVGASYEILSSFDQLDSLPLVNPRKNVVIPGNSVAETNISQAEGGNGDVVKHLAGRVISLEQELQRVRLQTRISASQIPRVVSCPEMHVFTDDIGDEMNVQKRFPDLVQDIDTMSFCDHLYSKDVITHAQMETIHAIFKRSGSTDANRELLKVMKTKRIEKSIMIQILEETQQQHLLKMFYPPKHSNVKK